LASMAKGDQDNMYYHQAMKQPYSWWSQCIWTPVSRLSSVLWVTIYWFLALEDFNEIRRIRPQSSLLKTLIK
jgi:hypothetical protein